MADDFVVLDEFPGYRIFRDGNIWSERSRRFLRVKTDPERYVLTCMMNRHGDSVTRSFHRLVATAYLGEPPGGHVVNHLNGVKSDNRVENLEWTTYKGNAQHYEHVLRPMWGMKRPPRMEQIPIEVSKKLWSSLGEHQKKIGIRRQEFIRRAVADALRKVESKQ